jgi:trimeric autotransporter adhesin
MAGSNDIEIRIRVRDQGATAAVNQIGNNARRGARGLDDMANGLFKFGFAIPNILGAAAALQQLAGAAALIPGAIGMGAAISGTLGLALGGVSEALSATSGAAGSAGAAVQDMSRQFRDANRRIEDAQRGVEDANRRLEDAHRGVAEALRRVEDAQRGVADANRAYARAQRDEEAALARIDDARRDAIRTLEDLAEAQDDSVRNVQGAELALKRALADQQKVMKDSKATYLDREEAAFRVKEAEDKLSDSQRESSDATEELADAQAKGVDGSDQVVAAQQAAADAHERTADAARGVEDAQRSVADAELGVADAKRDVADAERGVADAHLAVADAMQDLDDLYAQQAEGAKGAAGGVDAYAAALAKLSPEARQFVQAIVAMRDEWEAMQRSVQDEFFDGLSEKITALGGTYIPLLTTGLGGVAAALNGIAAYALDELLDPEVVKAVNVVLANTALFLDGARTSLGDFLAGFIQLAAIGSEYLAPIGEWLSQIAAQFRSWVETDPEGVRLFIEEALQGLSDLWAIGENVVGIISAIGEGLAGGSENGTTFLEMLRGLTEQILLFVSSDVGQFMLATLGTLVGWLIMASPVILTLIGMLKLAAIAQLALNLAMMMNPIGLVILAVGALVAAFIWAWNNIEGFREFWIMVWDAIVGAFNWAKDGIVAGWQWLVDSVTGAADWISQKLSGMWDGVKEGAKAAVNGAIWVLNGLITGVNWVIRGLNAVNPFGQIGEVGYISYLAKGGNAGGLAMVGENGPELVDLPTGSRVRTAGDTQRELGRSGGGGGGPTVLELHFSGNTDSAMATAIMKLQRTGQLQLRVAR